MAVSSSVPTNLFLALSPSPSPSSLIPSSTWLPFLQTRTRRPTHFTSHRLVVSLSFHTLASPNEDYPETEPPFDTVNKKKKKKKPRPSFYDQTLERWSVRISSQRSKFPWQERQVEEKKDPILPSPHVVDGVPSKGIPVNSSSRNHGVSAPWVHGKNPRKPHLEYEADTQVPKREVKFDGVGKKSRVDLIIKKLNSPLYYNSSSLNVEIPIDGSDDEDGHNSDDTSLLSPRPVEESPPITKPVGIPLGSRLATAPWAHGAKPRRADSNCISETQIPQSSLGFGGENSRDDSNVGRLNISLDQNCSDSNEGTPFAIFNHEERHNSKENTLCQSLPVDGGPAAIKTLGNTLGDGVIVPRKPHLDSEAKTPIQLDSLDSNGEGEKSRVTFIVEKLKRSLDPSNPNLDAGISFGKSDGEEGPNSDGDIIMGSISFPWERYSADSDGEELPTKSNTELAERTIPEPELRRLRNVALRMKERMKVGPAGTTEAVVESIHEKWKEAEVVKLKFEGPPSLNMKRTHEVLERKTGGLVVWRSGSSLVLYRGMAYKLPCVQSYPKLAYADASHIVIPPSDDSTTGITGDMDKDFFRASKSSGADVMSSFGGPTEGVTDAFDIDSFLDELGPRFKDWSGCNPLPVDADLLPCVVPGYKPPYRLLPYKIRSVLRNREMTSFRRLARTMPPHFALGRNRQHQGLAKAMVKLWEKSAIAKIAIKRGVPNTCNERMAEEIKKLTGGTLISRNKEYIVFYRGNDFLTPSIREVLVEKQELVTVQQDKEELARLRASDLIVSNARTVNGSLVAGTLAETLEANTRWANQPSSEDREKMMTDLALAKHASLVRYLERKLAFAKARVRKAEKALGQVQEYLKPADLPTDLETVTDEERFLFRRIGLKMRAFLLLGRREVFDGTVENMHLNWKHRELVKIIVKGKNFAQVKHIAISLEAESGGVLISLDRTTKGYAIIFYRGKNYCRPHILRPKNLLTRRQALARSIELQRREALHHHIADLRERIEMLKSELDQMESVKELGNENLYSQLDDTFCSDDDLEDEGEEAYLETYSSGDEDDDAPAKEFDS